MERIGHDVKRELGRFGPVVGLGKLVERWPETVGEGIARNAWPARIGRDGTVYVHTADAVWAFELTQRADEIRERLGDVTKLRFLPGPLPEPEPSPAETTSTRPETTTADVAQGVETAAEIGDEKLRNLVARAVAASLAKARSDHVF